MRRLVQAASLVIGVFIGYGVAVIASTPDGLDPSPTPGLGPRQEAGATTLPGSTTTVLTETTYLIWSTGGLTEGLVSGLSTGFQQASIVSGDVVELTVADDAVVALDAVALDPASHAPFDPTGSLTALTPGTVVLGATSAELRRSRPGDRLVIDDVQFRVVGVAPDEVVGAAEVVFHRDDPESPVVTDRYALVVTDQPRSAFESSVRSLYDGPAPLRIRAEGETPWLRHGDAVLPQVFIKEALGEFSYSDRTGGVFEQDPAFVEANIVSRDVPLLGTVTCHRVLLDMLVGAMQALVDEGLSHLVDPGGFSGCWNPRFIKATTGRSAGVSRHAWGAAVDINAAQNPIGSSGDQDPRLVAIMLDWGFTWGGDWLVPDPMHFEYGVLP